MKRAGMLIGCVVVAALVLARLLQTYDALPALMASHFDQAGRPNGFMSKGPLIVELALLQVLVPGPLAIAALFLHKLPTSMINLPHRDYWLGPERRASTLARIAGLLGALALASALLLACMIEQTLRANLGGGRLTQPVLPVALFAVFCLGCVVKLIWSYGRIPRERG